MEATRQDLYYIIDELPESALTIAYKILSFIINNEEVLPNIDITDTTIDALIQNL